MPQGQGIFSPLSLNSQALSHIEKAQDLSPLDPHSFSDKFLSSRGNAMSQYDLVGLFDFLKQTPEQGLRKMLVDNKPMGEAHFNLLLKIVRNCSVEQFSAHAEKSDFPKIKMGPAET